MPSSLRYAIETLQILQKEDLIRSNEIYSKPRRFYCIQILNVIQFARIFPYTTAYTEANKSTSNPNKEVADSCLYYTLVTKT